MPSVPNNTEHSNNSNNRYRDITQQNSLEKQPRGNYLKDSRWTNRTLSNLQTSQNRNKQQQRNISDWEKIIEAPENNYMTLMENPFSHPVM